MTVSQLRQLASDNGYALTATNKAGIISEINGRTAYRGFDKLS